MFSKQHRSGRSAWVLSALLACLLLPQAVKAEQYIIKNDTKRAVVVQATCIFRGVVRRDRPYPLQPNAMTPPLTWLGNKVITVYDAAVPTRILYRGTYPPSPTNLKLAISQDPAGRYSLKRIP